MTPTATRARHRITATLALLGFALVALAPLRMRALADGHRDKPVDGNRWGLARFRGGALMRGECARRPCIALTFDDGPDFNTTPQVLDELDRHNVRATFFVTGHRMDGDGEVAERNCETLRDDRPTLRSVRRERAARAWAQQDFRAVDQLLTPLVMSDPEDVRDRVRVIEARARDGRPADAARLVAGLRTATGPGGTGIDLAERARCLRCAQGPLSLIHI